MSTESTTPFTFRMRLGQHEIEICGSHEEVLSTIEELPRLIANISEAFSSTGIVNNDALKSAKSSANSSSFEPAVSYPSIQSSGGCGDAVLKLLSTEWGRAAPRTLPELVEAMRANAVHYPTTTLSGVLMWLVRKGKIKRWKTESGYVYVLASQVQRI